MGRAGRSSGGHSSSHSSSRSSNRRSSGRSGGGHRPSSPSSSSSSRSSFSSSSPRKKSSFHMTYDPYRNYGSGSYRNAQNGNPFETRSAGSIFSRLFGGNRTEYYNYDDGYNNYSDGYDEGYQDYSRPKGSFIGKILLILIPLVCLIGILGTFFVVFKFTGLKEQFTQETAHYNKYEGQVKAKEKLEGYYYTYDCIHDELGWFENESETEEKLKSFFDETGIQPYVLLKDYDSSLFTDDEKLEWAEEYFDKVSLNENTFLFVYFAEQNTDEDVGFMAYVLGSEANDLVGPQEINDFWDDVDYYWYQDIDTDDVFVKLFNDTAKNIMYE